MNPTVIGSAGVALLLIAYALNLVGRLSQVDRRYLAMNIVGSAMAAWYAWAGSNIPFVVLEGVWAAVSVGQIVSVKRKGHRS